MSPLKEVVTPRYNFRRGDYIGINKSLGECDWQTLLQSKSTENATKVLYETLHTLIRKHVPHYTIQSTSHSYPVWYSPALIKIVKEKFKAHKRWKKFNNMLDYDEFRLLRERQKRVQRLCYDNYISNTESAISRNPKTFWSYIKALRGGSNYPSRLTYNNKTYTDGSSICNAFNDFFRSVFGNPTSILHSESRVSSSLDSISKITISEGKVEDYLKRLDINKGAGSDGIPPIFWAKCARTLAIPIAFIFNFSIKEGVFPEIWKKALIVPIHKKGSKMKVENYRGISILNTVSKVFEKIVYNDIYPVTVNQIPENQHGFLKRHSTVTNLACFSEYIIKNMENGGQVDVVYTDFEKAFDRVDHSILINKLGSLGIHGDLLRWIESYLTKRSQAVVVGGFRSDYIEIPSGVPQGSHLGPLFYNSYIYDLPECLTYAKHLMYADDKKIFLKINKVSDCETLQAELNALYNYYSDNMITVNIKKCQCISFTRRTIPILYSYNFNGVLLERVSTIRDLGVHFDSKMTLTDHIDIITKKAYKNLGFVLRACKSFKNISSLKIVYFAYVRSLLEYASQIWSPHYNTHKIRLERIQKKFIKHISYRQRKSVASYPQACELNGLLTLEDRRDVLDICFLYDIIRGRVDCPHLLHGLAYCTPIRRTRHTPLLQIPKRRTNYSANTVMARLPRIYNQRFSEVDIFNFSKASFKKHLIKAISNDKSTH